MLPDAEVQTFERILLMTATVTPAPGVFLLQHRDPVARLNEYIAAFSFYADRLRTGVFDRIVFAENSGYDCAELRQVASDKGVADRVEFLGITPSAETQQSRFSLELALLSAAFERSTFIARSDRQQIWKVSGRYTIRNIDGIIRRAPRTADVVANFRDWPERTVDFYLIAMTPAVFRRLLDNRHRYTGLGSGEEILRQRLDAPEAADLVVTKRFAAPARIHASRGFDGAQYSGFADTVKFMIRSVVQIVLPRLRI